MPLADEGARFLKAKVQPVHELPPGMLFHYDLKTIYRMWQRWVMSGRQTIPDIRDVAVEDEDAVNDLWMMEMVIRYAMDSAGEGANHGSE